MRLLLDTHIWLWSVGQNERLSKPVVAALRNAENEIWLSPISLWETLLLAEHKRIVVDGSPREWINWALRVSSPREAELTYEVAVKSRLLNLPTRDPADLFIAATAAVHDLTLVTADKSLAKSKEFSVLAN